MSTSQSPRRVAAFRSSSLSGLGEVRDDRIHPLTAYLDSALAEPPIDHFYKDWDADSVDWTADPNGLRLEEVELLAPVRGSAKILCQVVNYIDHGREAAIDPPSHPFFFLRPASSVIGASQDISAHRRSSAVDFEVELAVVISRSGLNIERDAALDHVGALTVANDVSYRDVLFNVGHEDLSARFGQNWTHGKGLDGSCLLGPWLTIPDSHEFLTRSRRLECHVNGERRQSALSSEMIFDIADLVSAASNGSTLRSGDVILTGTPAGVGLSDQRYLSPGDRVRSGIEGLGQMENTVVAV